MIDCIAEGTQFANELDQWIAAVRATWTRKDPRACTAHGAWLRPDRRPRIAKRRSIRAHSQHRQPLWAIDAYRARESTPAGHEFHRLELASTRRGAAYEARDAEPGLNELLAVMRRQQSRCESGPVKRGPESVARPREMALRCRRVKARIDSTKQNRKSGRDEITSSAVGVRTSRGERGAPCMPNGCGEIGASGGAPDQ